jgi:spore coat protein U-like protein
MKKIVLAVTLMLLLGVMVCGAAYAATATGTVNVSATVLQMCSVSTTAVNFGNYDGSQYEYLANGDITVTCLQGIPYHIALDAGENYFSTRHISNGQGRYLQYQLYRDSSHYTQWGDADYANTFPYGSSFTDTGNGATQPHTVYGAMPNAQGTAPIPVGTYTDVVNVTVYY